MSIFQNQEVVESLTIPNVFLNESKLEDAHQIHFYSGDWGSFLELQMSNDVGELYFVMGMCVLMKY